MLQALAPTLVGLLGISLAHAIASPATGEACNSGGNVIGVTLDTSGSVSYEDVEISKKQITSFVDATSRFPNTNDNLYYLSYFDDTAYGGDSLKSNAGRQVSDAFEAVVTGWGGTDIVAGMNDIEAAFRGSGVSAGVAIVVTDGGCCTMETLQAAGDDLRAIGVTVVGVGIGYADQDSLEAFASKDADGKPLVFSGAEFDQIESLLVGALQDIDSDGDGLSDCMDGCPSDEKKAAPGICGCGVDDSDCDEGRDAGTDAMAPASAVDESSTMPTNFPENSVTLGSFEASADMSRVTASMGYGSADAAGYGSYGQ